MRCLIKEIVLYAEKIYNLQAALSRSTAYLDRTLLIYETVLIEEDAGKKLLNFFQYSDWMYWMYWTVSL